MQKKIRVLNVAPGVIDTRKNKNKKILKKVISEIPNNRLGKAEDVANLLDFLIDDKSRVYQRNNFNNFRWQIKKNF